MCALFRNYQTKIVFVSNDHRPVPVGIFNQTMRNRSSQVNTFPNQYIGRRWFYSLGILLAPYPIWIIQISIRTRLCEQRNFSVMIILQYEFDHRHSCGTVTKFGFLWVSRCGLSTRSTRYGRVEDRWIWFECSAAATTVSFIAEPPIKIQLITTKLIFDLRLSHPWNTGSFQWYRSRWIACNICCICKLISNWWASSLHRSTLASYCLTMPSSNNWTWSSTVQVSRCTWGHSRF